MSLFCRNIIEKTFPSAKVIVIQNYYLSRSICILPKNFTYYTNSLYHLMSYGLRFGSGLGNYNYWCLNVVRVSSSRDFFRLTTLCPTIINGVYHNTGYTFDVGEDDTVWEGDIIALNKSYNNYDTPS